MPAFIYAVLLLMNIHIVKLRTIINPSIQNPMAINTVNQTNRLKISGSLYKHVIHHSFNPSYAIAILVP